MDDAVYEAVRQTKSIRSDRYNEIKNAFRLCRWLRTCIHFREDTKTLETLPVSNCAKLCKSALVAVNLRQSSCVCIILSQSASFCTILRHSAPVFSDPHYAVPICTNANLHQPAPTCTNLFKPLHVSRLKKQTEYKKTTSYTFHRKNMIP